MSVNVSSTNLENIIEELKQRMTFLESKLARQEKALRKFKRDMIPEDQRKTRKPSGFAKPTYLSSALCEFLEIPPNSELARTEVTKRLLAYVKEKNLQNTTNHRNIDCDERLSKLLNPVSDEPVTYFNIQRLLKVHYTKPPTTDEEAPLPPTEVPSTPTTTKKASTSRVKKSKA